MNQDRKVTGALQAVVRNRNVSLDDVKKMMILHDSVVVLTLAHGSES